MMCVSNAVVIGEKSTHNECYLRFSMVIGFVMVRYWFLVQEVE